MSNVSGQEASQKNVRLGIKAGIGKTLFYGKSHYAYTGGIIVIQRLADLSPYDLEYGVLYSHKNLINVRRGVFGFGLNYNYLVFPFLLKYSLVQDIHRKFKPVVGCGFSPSLLISGSSVNSGFQYSKEGFNIFKGYNSSFKPMFDCSIDGSFGVNIKSIYIGSQIQIGLVNLSTQEFLSIAKVGDSAYGGSRKLNSLSFITTLKF